ncbi:RNA polymerase sigma factor [Humibacter ginsenosidimutans]|uniref:RNA polymerase sigma factor n=1 Tax=Humibacter ginsenosidimutans TaxID=2599293 RepID=A0A5B8M0X3_9MICO|nr:RNA polymerase sigma factor [Humibacter ginsenosidimutans]QDZ13916.1 RNA polymerase sigma factor [Humibacter ginsenosidimutans]
MTDEVQRPGTGTQAVVSEDVARSIETVWRLEAAKVVATLTRMVGDLGRAEDLAQDALVEAMQSWPRTGIPRNPAAWLTSVGKRRAIDAWRRDERAAEKYALIAAADTGTEDRPEPDEERIDDDLLRLVFICCHPVLPQPSRVALALRVLCGLSTEEIARAYLVPPATIGQRITRAKRSLAAAGVPFEVPERAEFDERLASVLEVVYLVFNEGYAATAGDEWMRPVLAEDAMRLGRVLAELVPDRAEAHALVALMELHASRFAARRGPDGAAVPLAAQDRSRWDRLLIAHGLEALRRADALGGERGPYALQAAIAACHVRALTVEDTDWEQIAALYDALSERMPSPVVELNRAVAVGMAYGPEAGLEALEPLRSVKEMKGYALLPAVRGDLLERMGLLAEAREQFLAAASLTANERERDELVRRAAGADPLGGGRAS